jgi:hypothetical protein
VLAATASKSQPCTTTRADIFGLYQISFYMVSVSFFGSLSGMGVENQHETHSLFFTNWMKSEQHNQHHHLTTSEY